MKVFWWGNVAAVFGGYFALWMAGLALGGVPPRAWMAWVALAAAVCAVDYGVFLNECAGDAAAERAHRLKTLPALLGERRTSALAISLLVLGASAVAGLLIRFWPRLDGFQVAALAWHTAVQGLSALSTMLVYSRWPQSLGGAGRFLFLGEPGRRRRRSSMGGRLSGSITAPDCAGSGAALDAVERADHPELLGGLPPRWTSRAGHQRRFRASGAGGRTQGRAGRGQ